MSGRTRRPGSTLAGWIVPIGLFLLAVAIRLVAAALVPFPTTEPSAYYVAVARNLMEGDGLVSDAIWSFATPPLVTPKPAFELWLPMSSFVSALAMALLGPGFWAAQVGGALLGGLVAPLAWAIGREAAHSQGLDGRRPTAVAIAAGLLAAVLSPFVLASIVPDSYTPFLVFVSLAALLVPRVLGVCDGRDCEPPARPSILAGLALGAVLGLAYLSRQEVIWLGLTILLMTGWVVRDRPGRRAREALDRLWPVVVGGLVLVAPWLLRNTATFGSPFPGQAVENAFLVRNEDIFAFAERPSAAAYLDQGLLTILGNPLAATWDGLVNVIAVPAFPVGLAGLVAIIGLRHTPALRRPTALVALLVSGALTFLSTVILFPVATLWGTFLHASGPLLMGLAVVAALGGDALLARISAIRGWQRPNVVIAPVALVAVTGMLMLLQVRLFAAQSVATEARFEGIGTAIERVAAARGERLPGTLISDHPIWIAEAVASSAVALPDEDIDSIIELARWFDAPWLIVVDERGRYPTALLEGPARRCLADSEVALTEGSAPAWLFILDEGCAG